MYIYCATYKTIFMYNFQISQILFITNLSKTCNGGVFKFYMLFFPSPYQLIELSELKFESIGKLYFHLDILFKLKSSCNQCSINFINPA